MDARQTMIEAYRRDVRFAGGVCEDPDCSDCDNDCDGFKVTVDGDAGPLMDDLMTHMQTICDLLCLQVYRETRH
jgi:hypothetical protein